MGQGGAGVKCLHSEKGIDDNQCDDYLFDICSIYTIYKMAGNIEMSK